MKQVSNTDSADTGEITVSVIIECLTSFILYIGLCAYLNSLQPLLIAASLAPLFLFQTELSRLSTLNAYRKINNFYKKIFHQKYFISGNYKFLKGIVGLLLGCLYSISIAITGILCRILITLFCFVRFPLITLRAMPANWKRQVLCTDFNRTPEIIPGENKIKKEVITFESFKENITSFWKESKFLGILISIPYIPILLLGYIPAYLLRFSFKATSIFYAPFIWIADTNFNTSYSLQTRLEFITKGQQEKIRRTFSKIIFFILLLILFGIQIGGELIEIRFKGEKIENIYPLIQELAGMYPWPVWPYFFIIEVVITYYLFYFADRNESIISGKSPYCESKIDAILSFFLFSRNSLGVITIVITFIMAISFTRFESALLFTSSFFK